MAWRLISALVGASLVGFAREKRCAGEVYSLPLNNGRPNRDVVHYLRMICDMRCRFAGDFVANGDKDHDSYACFSRRQSADGGLNSLATITLNRRLRQNIAWKKHVPEFGVVRAHFGVEAPLGVRKPLGISFRKIAFSLDPDSCCRRLTEVFHGDAKVEGDSLFGESGPSLQFYVLDRKPSSSATDKSLPIDLVGVGGRLDRLAQSPSLQAADDYQGKRESGDSTRERRIWIGPQLIPPPPFSGCSWPAAGSA